MNTQPALSTPPTWKEAHLRDIAQYIVPEKSTDTGELIWGRLIVDWNEITPERKVITHTYAACIDGQAGELYVDCSPGLIFKKCLFQLLLRPLHSIAKTVYHAAMVPLFTEIPLFIRKERSLSDLIGSTLLCAADIILTPLYGVAIMAASVYVLAHGLLNPTSLYDGRKLIGRMEEAANRGHKHTKWTLTACFQSTPLEGLANYEIPDYSADTLYPSKSSLDKQLTNFARSKVRHLQKHFNVFSCTELAKGEQYISPILFVMDGTKDAKNPSDLCFYPVNIISS